MKGKRRSSEGKGDLRESSRASSLTIKLASIHRLDAWLGNEVSRVMSGRGLRRAQMVRMVVAGGSGQKAW